MDKWDKSRSSVNYFCIEWNFQRIGIIRRDTYGKDMVISYHYLPQLSRSFDGVPKINYVECVPDSWSN